ncbi:MAG: GNAT family N-acetyltransferase [Bacillota bacterium]|nr:GNAT family N-acetyltransferase [Bacillota bacterium]
MDKKYWIERLEKNEVESMVLLSCLLNDEGISHLNDSAIENTLIATYDFGFVKRGRFYSENIHESIESIAKWFQENNVELEATYDNMVMIFNALGIKSYPNRLYLMKHICNQEKEFKSLLDYEFVNPLIEYKNFLKKGISDFYKLNKNEINRLFNSEDFINDMEKGIYIFKKENVPIGYIMIKYQTNNLAEISNLWLKKEYRHKGYSSEIIKKIIEIKKKDGRCVIVTVKNDNYGLIRLFEDENFELIKIMSKEILK